MVHSRHGQPRAPPPRPATDGRRESSQACGSGETAALWRLHPILVHRAREAAARCWVENVTHALSFDAVDALISLPVPEAEQILCTATARGPEELHAEVLRQARGHALYTQPEQRTVFVIGCPLPPRPDWAPLDNPRDPAKVPKCMVPLLTELTRRFGQVLKFALRDFGCEPRPGMHAFFEFVTADGAQRCCKATELMEHRVRAMPTNNGPITKGFTLSHVVQEAIRAEITPTPARVPHYVAEGVSPQTPRQAPAMLNMMPLGGARQGSPARQPGRLVVLRVRQSEYNLLNVDGLPGTGSTMHTQCAASHYTQGYEGFFGGDVGYDPNPQWSWAAPSGQQGHVEYENYGYYHDQYAAMPPADFGWSPHFAEIPQSVTPPRQPPPEEPPTTGRKMPELLSPHTSRRGASSPAETVPALAWVDELVGPSPGRS
eukprot:TRINITY_DN1064_c0_g1_i1.p1 TRINITY_DN1064_c0_g1~~TRINITY_DN1064_c0_g1_i1.p1  ORF type:complete len:468 (+),score=114.18 TRINITY_DN1064_c0_g1_i1:113-1405(+)